MTLYELTNSIEVQGRVRIVLFKSGEFNEIAVVRIETDELYYDLNKVRKEFRTAASDVINAANLPVRYLYGNDDELVIELVMGEDL